MCDVADHDGDIVVTESGADGWGHRLFRLICGSFYAQIAVAGADARNGLHNILNDINGINAAHGHILRSSGGPSGAQ